MSLFSNETIIDVKTELEVNGGCVILSTFKVKKNKIPKKAKRRE